MKLRMSPTVWIVAQKSMPVNCPAIYDQISDNIIF